MEQALTLIAIGMTSTLVVSVLILFMLSRSSNTDQASID